MRQDAWVVVLGRGWSPDVSGRVEAACVLTHVEPAMRQDAWVVVLGRGWSPDVSGRVEAACVLTHVEPALRQDAWVVVLGRGWSPDVSGRVEAACVLTHVEPAMRQDAWERKRGGGVSSQDKKMCVVTFQDNFTKLCPHNFLFIIQVIPDMIAGVPEKCELSHFRTLSQNCALTISCLLWVLNKIYLLACCKKNVPRHISGKFYKIVFLNFLLVLDSGPLR